MTGTLPTAQFASLVYGASRVPIDDPAEGFHEASRLYPNIAPDRLDVMAQLASSHGLGSTVARSSCTRDHLPSVVLPGPELPQGTLGGALARRRSRRPETLRRVRIDELATVLAASYAVGVRQGGALQGALDSQAPGARRSVPSAGALYPLEVYVLSLAVEGLDCAAYHYNPFGHRLARLGELARPALHEAFAEPRMVEESAVLLVVTAVFWRSRFKYGQRGYRFALLEAGHLVQNAVLVAADLGLPALPLGGFYDRRLDEIVGADGLDEASVYALALGGTV